MARKTRPPHKSASRSLTIRLDEDARGILNQAATLRGIGASDYVWAVAVPQARRELEAAREQIIALTPEEQLAFWQALHQPAKLTAAQRRLGATMRGDAGLPLS